MIDGACRSTFTLDETAPKVWQQAVLPDAHLNKERASNRVAMVFSNCNMHHKTKVNGRVIDRRVRRRRWTRVEPKA
jgi:hypothetical protein